MLRWIEGWEMGLVRTRYNAGGLSYDWTFTTGSGGAISTNYTGTGRWVPTSGVGGGSYAMSIPYESTALSRSLTATQDPDIDSWVLGFAFTMDAASQGMGNHRVLVEILDGTGNPYVRVRTVGSATPVELEGQVWNGSDWVTAWQTAHDWVLGTPYWIALEFRRGAAPSYTSTFNVYRGTLTSAVTKLRTGDTVNLGADRYIGKVRWTGVVDTDGGGAGVTIVDSIMLWTDPDADSPDCVRSWFVQGLEATADQVETGDVSFAPQGVSTNADAVASTSGSAYVRATLQTGGGTGTQALRIQTLADVDSSLVFPVVRDFGGVGVTLTATNDTGVNNIAGLLWRGGSYLPFNSLDYLWSAPAAEQYLFEAYGVDPTGEKWTAATVGDASMVLLVDGGNALGTVEFQRAVVQVAWNGLDPIRSRFTGPGPDAYILVHDPALVSTDASLGLQDGVDAVSQQGPAIGPLYPAKSNEGNLMPFHAGEEWDTTSGTKHPTPTGLDYRLQVAGGVLSTAEWAWKFQDDPPDRYRGQLDLRLERDVHRPWSTNSDPDSLIAFTSTAFRRVLAGRYSGPPDYRWEIRYHSTTETDRTLWNQETYIPNADGLLVSGLAPGKLPDIASCPYSVMWETPDGALRFAYTYGAISLPGADMDIWGSTDGGLTWSLLQEGVLSGVMGRNCRPYYITADTSGDWVRISFMDLTSTPQGICTIASSDRGSTWSLVQGTPDGEDVFSGNFNPSRFQVHDVVGVDTVDGLFLRFRRTASSSRIQVEVASGLDDWTQHPKVGTALYTWSSTNLESLQVVRTPTHLWFLMWETDGTNTRSKLCGFGVQRDHVLDYGWTDGYANPRTQEWTVFAKYSDEGAHPLGQSAYYQPTQWRMTWTGDSLLLVGGQYSLGSGSPAVQARTVASYLGGWDQFPTHGTEAINVGRDDGLFDLAWLAHYGPPALAPSSPWIQTTTGSPGITDTYYRLQLDLGPSERVFYQYTGGANMADAGVVEWTCALPTGLTYFTGPATPSSMMLPRAGMSTSATSASGTTVHIGVHLTDVGVFLFDALAGVTLWSDPNVDPTFERTYRVRFSDSSGVNRAGVNWYVELQHKSMGTDGPWVSSGLITTSNGHLSGYGLEAVRWGHVATVAGTAMSRWYGFAFSTDEHLGGVPGGTNPESIRGAQLSYYPHHTAQGVNVTWGGGGGFVGDLWTSAIRYEYGVDQLASPSPAMVWRTDGHTTTSVVMDAAKYRNTAAQVITDRFHHNAVALVGTNFRYAWVDYAEATAFSSTVPTAAMTVDAAVFNSRISAAGTNTVDVSQVGSTVERDSHLRSNAVAGWLVEYSDPTAGSTYDGSVFRILESWDNRVRLDYTPAAASTILQAGGTLTFFPPWMVLPFGSVDSAHASGIDQRFLRLQLRTEGNSIPELDTGFQVGRFVAGMTLPISVPMEWEASDEEEGNVSLFTAPSGVRASYKQGVPRRTVEGTSVGDVSRWRDSWRGTIRTISQYDLHPMVLVRDSNADTLSALYGRMVESTELANVGYRYNGATGRWEAVGDVSMTWEEEV